MISMGTEGKLSMVSKLVTFLKSMCAPSPPILIGGAVMSMVEDVASCTGADYAFNDVGAALEAIGLKPDALCTLKRA
jgi:hypothetical protein